MTAQREWFEKDYYKVLGVGEKATPKEITKAYRAAARDSHPDTHPGDAKAEERFKEVSAAYDVLGDEAKRKEYDEVRALGPMGGGFGPGGPGAGGFNFNVGADGLGDLLGQMFNRGGRGGRGRGASAGAGPQRGADVEATLTLDFVDAAKGLTTTLSLTSDAPCSTCHGSGARPGTQPTVCSQCGVFISEMYRVRKGDQDFCTHCFAKAAKNPKTADNANTSKAILHDVRAEYWTFLPFLFAWPLTVITGWVGLFIVIRYWKNPGGLLPRRSHLRMFITALFAVLEIIGASAFWLFVVLF